MLCKVKEDAYMPFLGTPTLLKDTITFTASGEHTIYSGNFNGEKATYKIYGTENQKVGGAIHQLKLKMGDNQKTRQYSGIPAYTDYVLEETIEKSTNSTENLTVSINFPSSYSTEFTFKQCYIQQITKNIPGTTGVTGKPRSLKSISQKANITIFGLHTDNTRITQDVE